MKNIKIYALTFIMLMQLIIPACLSSEPTVLGTMSVNSENNILTEIFERARIYENLYVDGDEISDNLRSAVSEARKLSLSGSPGNEEAQQAYDNFCEAEASFKQSYITNTDSKIPNSGLINKLYINDIKCAFDSESGIFCYTMGKKPDKELKFIFYVENLNSEKVYAEILDGESSLEWKFVPELNKEYTLRAHTRERVYDYKIMFTMLPIIQIDIERNIRDEYRDSIISVTDPDFEYMSFNGESVASDFHFESNAGIRLRGAMARGLPKNSYAIKFWENEQNKNVQLFNLRKDSDWILDAMYIDKARMRNRVSTDIWHDMDSQLYYMQEGQEQINGTRGVFVEVFLNNEYRGLYCFTEKIDRQQLQLNKNEEELKSTIYKGKSWGEALLFRTYYDYNNDWSWWDSFEQKYPRPAKGGQIEWAPLADFVKFFVNSSDEEFAADVDKYIDVQNFVEYAIFMCISYAYDNTGKNAYWSCYDMTDENMNKIFLTPWDLDASWGASWDGSKLYGSATQTWMDSEYEHDTKLFRRLVLTNAGGFADKMLETWERLKHNALSPETILKRFNDYFDLFEKSGAWDRECLKWRESELNIDEERAYIKDWVEARWVYIDDLIRNKLDTVGDFAPQPPRWLRRR